MGVTVGTSKTFGTDATITTAAYGALSAEVQVPDGAQYANVQLYFTAHATGAGTVTAYIRGSLDGTKYSMVGIPIAHVITANVANVANISEIKVAGMCKLKAIIYNADAAQSITLANVIVTFW